MGGRSIEPSLPGRSGALFLPVACARLPMGAIAHTEVLSLPPLGAAVMCATRRLLRVPSTAERKSIHAAKERPTGFFPFGPEGVNAVRRGAGVDWRPATAGKSRMRLWAAGLALAAIIAVAFIAWGLRVAGGSQDTASSTGAVDAGASAERVEPLRVLNPGAAARPRRPETRVRQRQAIIGHESPPPRVQPPPRRGPADY